MKLKILAAITVALPAALSGCGGETSTTQVSSKTTKVEAPSPEGDEVAAERAKLSKEDRTLVDAQEWCVVNSGGRLGSMGAPVKLMIKGQPVFLCCAGCKRKAESDPDKTLAKLEDLKRKAKAAKNQKD
jgi:hypothetical protein